MSLENSKFPKLGTVEKSFLQELTEIRAKSFSDTLGYSDDEALRAVKKISGKTKIIGVTILTSLDNKALKEIGFKKNVEKLVLQQAKLANKAKLDALVVVLVKCLLLEKFLKKKLLHRV